MVYNPKGFTDNSPRYIIKPTPVKKPSAIKLPCLFINLLDVKKKTSIHRVGASK